MKTRAVKRQPKPVEDQHAKYVAPMASQAAGKLVIDALTEMSNRIYDDYAAAVTKYYISEAERLDKLDAKDQRDVGSEMFVVFRNIWSRGDSYSTREPYRLVKHYKKLLTDAGIEAAKDMQQHFVWKNAKKLASIMDAKDSPLVGKPVILKAQAGVRGMFEGDMRIAFKDGSSFEVRNQVIWKRSVHGLVFNQYPTTFHNVILPNGKAMGQPSEERMNEIFVKA